MEEMSDGDQTTTLHRPGVEKSGCDPGRARTTAPPVRSLRQRMDACRTALFSSSRQAIAAGLLVVSQWL